MSDTAQDQARAQVSSIVDMVAALECDYDRLGELRDSAKEWHYVAGWNMPGYMPDNEPEVFDDANDARGYIASAIEAQADDDDETGDGEPRAQTLRADATTLRTLTSDKGAAEFGATLGQFHYWINPQQGLTDPKEIEELAEREAAAGECTDADDARQRIEEDALSVDVRIGWHSPGETLTPDEFRIVLCTGGPHVEIVGDLDEHMQPSRVRVLYRDWGDSGELFDFDHDAVLAYARCFYFGT